MTPPAPRLKIAFLIGSDSPSTRLCIESICRLPNVEPVGILFDVYQPPASARWKNLRRNVKREGAGYLLRRAIRGLKGWLDGRAAAITPRAEVNNLLRAAFPERCFHLDDIRKKYGIPVHEIANLNSPAAADCLRASGAALGVVIGTRILKRSTFGVPAMGCINIHKGKVPEYRGMPPGFWELYEGAATAGVTVHFVDDGLDTGDMIGTGEIPIHPKETVASLRTKLDHEGARVLMECVAQLASGTAQRTPQPPSTRKPRTKPLASQEKELAARSAHLAPRESDLKAVLKTLLYLGFWYSGLYALKRRLGSRGRAMILLYHRVNDIADDALTASTKAFAQHLVTLKRHYQIVETSRLVASVRNRGEVPSGAVAIHFDDCYRDVCQEAGPLLAASNTPATMFISTGFIDTDRIFEHDRAKYPHRFENLRHTDIPELFRQGLDIGAHTVNHVNMGEVSLEQAQQEIAGSKQRLEELSGREIPMFSFPFGKEKHIREEVRDLVRAAGFESLFSAHGGYVTSASDPFDIPRMGVNGHFRPLDLLMEMEGLGVSQLLARKR